MIHDKTYREIMSMYIKLYSYRMLLKDRVRGLALDSP